MKNTINIWFNGIGRAIWIVFVCVACSELIISMIESNDKVLQALSIFILPITVFLAHLGHWRLLEKTINNT